jgi:hypothetical protein
MISRVLPLALFFFLIGRVNSQSFTEGFENIATLTDWYIQNNSDSPDLDWGVGDITVFPAQVGTTGSYLSVNYQSTLSTAPATISNWLFAPTRTLNNGDIISFYTRTTGGTPVYPDRLEVRLSTAGNGTNPGTTTTSVGTFTTLLLSVNPNLTTTAYPIGWTQYSVTISGLPGPTNGRVAFRYFVTNGGPGGANSNFIGIDSYSYTSVATPPSNDACANAINLTQGTTCVATSGSVMNATQSAIGCSGTANNDVWYKFTANTTGAIINLVGSIEFDAVFEVFNGSSCANLTSLTCIDNTFEGATESTTLTNLVPGQTYYIRVHDWLDGIPNTMGFTICVVNFTPCALTPPVGSIVENELCGTDGNGGCNATPNAYQPISCGQTVFGNAWATNGNRDLDWYQFQLVEPGVVTWSATAEFPYNLYIVDISNCANPAILATASFMACQNGSISYPITIPSNYAVLIAPNTFDGYACGTSNDYFATLNLPVTNPSLSSSPSFICANDSSLVSGNLSGGYEWFQVGNQTSLGLGNSFFIPDAQSYYAKYTNGNGCIGYSDTISVTVVPLDDATFYYPTNTVCVNSLNLVPTIVMVPPFGYFTSEPANIQFVDNFLGEIDMTQALEGNYTITFHTEGICPNTYSQNLTITSNPSAEFSYSNLLICNSDSIQSVVLSPNSSIGFFSANSSLIDVAPNSGDINPLNSSNGTFVIYNTIAASGSCSTVIDSFLVQIDGPIINFPPIDTLCPNAPIFDLNATPIGGVFSGISVTNNQFDVSIGSCIVTYTVVDANNCSSSTNQPFTVEPSTPLSFGAYPDQCADSDPLSLNLGTPTGGFYSGLNIQNNSFLVSNAAVGGNSFYYVYTSNNGCTDSIQGAVIVRENPIIIFDPLPSTCDTTASIVLAGVSPVGGVFTGNGVTNGSFFPSSVGSGSYVVSYSITINGCSSIADQNITVDNCAGLIENSSHFSISPNPSTGTVFIESTNVLDQIQILTIDGRIVKNINQLESQSVLINDLAPASYFILLKSGELFYHYQLIVQ